MISSRIHAESRASAWPGDQIAGRHDAPGQNLQRQVVHAQQVDRRRVRRRPATARPASPRTAPAGRQSTRRRRATAGRDRQTPSPSSCPTGPRRRSAARSSPSDRSASARLWSVAVAGAARMLKSAARAVVDARLVRHRQVQQRQPDGRIGGQREAGLLQGPEGGQVPPAAVLRQPAPTPGATCSRRASCRRRRSASRTSRTAATRRSSGCRRPSRSRAGRTPPARC